MSSEIIERKTWLGMSKIAWWSLIGIFFINILGGAFHFVFELSGYWRPAAFFASVNESTWEHLKFYFWSGLLWALIEYTYVRKEANNYWFAHGLALLITPLIICIAFYTYLGVAIPKWGGGFLAADISTGVIGVIIGQIFASKIMQMPRLQPSTLRWGPAVLALLLVMFSTFTYYPPKFFLFEDFMGYEYRGQYGILDDYTEYRIFE